MNANEQNEDNDAKRATTSPPPTTMAIVPWMPKQPLFAPALITPTKLPVNTHHRDSEHKEEYYHISKKIKPATLHQSMPQEPIAAAGFFSATSSSSSSKDVGTTSANTNLSHHRRKWDGPIYYEPRIHRRLMARSYLQNKQTGLWRSDWWEGLLTAADYKMIDKKVEEAYKEIEARKAKKKQRVNQAMTFNAGEQAEDDPTPSNNNNANLKTPEE